MFQTGILFLLLSLMSSTLFAKSAYRGLNETYKHAVIRNLGTKAQNKPGTAYGNRVSYSELNVPNELDFESSEKMLQFFEILRDKQFIEHNHIMRRSSWMYPQDGCWIRAELMNRNLVSENHPPLRKLFIFGPLRVSTNYSSYGFVTWWYHVAPIARTPDGLYIMDPSINANSPMLLQDWILKQVENVEQAELALCEANTYNPGSSCLSASLQQIDDVISGQKTYLDNEEHNLERLGLPVGDYLGDTPPWKSQSVN